MSSEKRGAIVLILMGTSSVCAGLAMAVGAGGALTFAGAVVLTLGIVALVVIRNDPRP